MYFALFLYLIAFRRKHDQNNLCGFEYLFIFNILMKGVPESRPKSATTSFSSTEKIADQCQYKKRSLIVFVTKK